MAVSVTGERIRQCRKKLGISADSLAEKIGVSRATMYRYENGEIEKVPVDLISPLAMFLGVSPGYLMGWADDPNDYADIHASNVEKPTPVSESGLGRNVIKIAGRDGSFVERELTDDQVALIKNMLNQLKPIDDENI